MWWHNPILLGLAGGLLGVAVWAAMVFRYGRHFGWFVAVVGGLVGVGVRGGADGRWKSEYGEIAVVMAIGCMVLGKYTAAHWMAARLRLAERTDDEYVTSILADRIVERKRARGEKIDWPPEKNYLGSPFRWRYPDEIWVEAERQWIEMSPAERKAEIKQQKREFAELLPIANFRRICFATSFNLLHLIWIAVGVLAAFAIASGKFAALL
ncbi:MAG TPA: hypothetical protein VFI31_13285 [Pirellulales bacterium]|nr:hypothetical protein [Pirellulales bacterium]